MNSAGAVTRRVRLAWVAWLALAVFIVAGSAGRWSPYAPGVWAPTMVNARDVAINVALYVPFGICGMLALRRAGARGVARVIGIAMLFSVGVEALQLYTVDRIASLTDVVSAAVGTATGASLVALWRSPK
jgi:VanZ family protein